MKLYIFTSTEVNVYPVEGSNCFSFDPSGMLVVNELREGKVLPKTVYTHKNNVKFLLLTDDADFIFRVIAYFFPPSFDDSSKIINIAPVPVQHWSYDPETKKASRLPSKPSQPKQPDMSLDELADLL